MADISVNCFIVKEMSNDDNVQLSKVSNVLFSLIHELRIKYNLSYLQFRSNTESEFSSCTEPGETKIFTQMEVVAFDSTTKAHCSLTLDLVRSEFEIHIAPMISKLTNSKLFNLRVGVSGTGSSVIELSLDGQERYCFVQMWRNK